MTHPLTRHRLAPAGAINVAGIRILPTDVDPAGLAMTAASALRATNIIEATVTDIDAATRVVVANFPVGEDPNGITYRSGKV